MKAIRALMPLLLAAFSTAAPPASQAERDVFQGINRERAAHGVPALIWDDSVAKLARDHSARMRDLHYFSHEDPKFGGVSDRLTHAGIHWTACAENLHQQQGYPNPAQFAVVSWMNSPGHRRNLLDPHYTRTGIGIVTRPDGTYYFTQIFVRP